MTLTSREIAEQASFHAFANCYLREVDGGRWLSSDEIPPPDKRPDIVFLGNQLLQLDLPCVGLHVLFDVAYRSRVGRHHFHAVYTCSNTDFGAWQGAELMYLIISLVRELYQAQLSPSGSDSYKDSVKLNEMELLSRVMDSYQLMTKFLELRKGDASLLSDLFIDAEQSALVGHWLHPTPKSRQGMAFWQLAHYSPELRGAFQLHYFSVDKSLVLEASLLDNSASQILADELKACDTVSIEPGHVAIPVHPLQAHFLLLQTWVRDLLADGRMKYLGERGDAYTATSSVRTLFNAKSKWMLKFSIPVKITNSLRSNMRDELEDGMLIHSFLEKSGFMAANPQFKMVDDPAYITVNKPGDGEAESGFELVLRRNLFSDGYGKSKGEGVCTVLSLCQASPLGLIDKPTLLKQVIEKLADKEQRSLADVAMHWFDRYWHCSIETLIRLYDEHGIALEAHQQNALLDISSGYPSCFYYRDSQGYYISKNYHSTIASVEDQMRFSRMIYDDKWIFNAFSYYVVVNQLFAIIYRLGADKLIDEQSLIKRAQAKLRQQHQAMNGIGAAFIEHLLTSAELSSKNNLLARVNDIDELHEGMERSVYATMKNPLCEHAENTFTRENDKKGTNNAAYAYS
ncbi:IucA/IucC family protein [Agaribacterium haliotis]|uniref:IucA/IucC family protein n=1 Tax=Agaribacterium haliotis TaxID=2013869 RepID=UPI000BB571ED|nr:IucA/IucC family protein [Agaribacterium haliotis]